MKSISKLLHYWKQRYPFSIHKLRLSGWMGEFNEPRNMVSSRWYKILFCLLSDNLKYILEIGYFLPGPVPWKISLLTTIVFVSSPGCCRWNYLRSGDRTRPSVWLTSSSDSVFMIVAGNTLLHSPLEPGFSSTQDIMICKQN